MAACVAVLAMRRRENEDSTMSQTWLVVDKLQCRTNTDDAAVDIANVVVVINAR